MFFYIQINRYILIIPLSILLLGLASIHKFRKNPGVALKVGFACLAGFFGVLLLINEHMQDKRMQLDGALILYPGLALSVIALLCLYTWDKTKSVALTIFVLLLGAGASFCFFIPLFERYFRMFSF